MPAFRPSLRLAFWLSLLALCSALLAPASVLAQEMRSGKWTGLCTAGVVSHGQPEGQVAGEGGHCEMCALPGLALPGPAPIAAWVALREQAPAQVAPPAPMAQALRGPAIRAPPYAL